ncbi:MAG: type II secretion system protein N [Pseudomonadales bacterium]
MKGFFATFFAVLIVLVLAILNAPASLVPMALQEVEARGLLQPGAPKLTLSQTSGTVWEGEAAQAVLLVDGVPLALGKLSWQLSLMSLLEKNPSLQLFAQAADHQLQALISATEQGEVTIRHIEGNLPISLLEPWFPMLIKGEVAFVIDHLVFDPRQLLALDGVLNFEYVDWLGGEYDIPLGSYLVQLSLDDKKNIMLQLNDFSATLGIDGFVLISQQGSYHFNATLFPRENLAPEIAQSITWFGKKDEQGNVRINKRGHF